MKNLKIITLILGITFFISCDKNRDNLQPVKTMQNINIAACQDTIPTGITCQAFFVRWFYDKSTNSCSQIGYSGCGPLGFATETECESCKCNTVSN